MWDREFDGDHNGNHHIDVDVAGHRRRVWGQEKKFSFDLHFPDGKFKTQVVIVTDR